MKTRIEIENVYRKVRAFLQKNLLKDAFDALGTLLNGENLWQFADRKNELEDTYRTMLRYVVEGAPDPERTALLEKLRNAVTELADALRERLLVRLADNYEYQEIQRNALSMRECQSLKNEFSLLSPVENRAEYERLTMEIFNRLWLTERYTEAEYDLLQSASGQPVVVSAVMLHLLRLYDEKSLLLLFDISETETDNDLRCRAMVALAVAMYKYDDRFESHPALRNRLLLASENTAWRADFIQAMLQIVRTKDTDAVTKKLKEKILPEMIKFRTKIEREISSDEEFMKNFSEENPEWKKKLKLAQDYNFSEKLMDEFLEMQKNGADVFMSSFAQLKNFDFFAKVSNWFLPFDISHSSLQKSFTNETEKRKVDLMLQSGYMCDSDKYSFCLSLSQIPSSQRDMLFLSMGADRDALEEMYKDRKAEVTKKNVIFSACLQNVYRYYRIFGNRQHLTDIFTMKFAFVDTHFAQAMRFSVPELLKFAEYYFVSGHYEEALVIYERMSLSDKDAEIYQKTGFCHQHLQQFGQALDCYERADLMLPDNKWTLRRLAFCYRIEKRYEKALDCYRRLSAQQPDDLDLMLNEGYCQMELQAYDDAFRTFFKAEYTAPANRNVFRALLWCSFLSHKFEQAEKYAEKLMTATPNAVDLMNVGHVKWALGKRHEALNFYCQSVRLDAKSINGFMENIARDSEALKEKAQISDEEYKLMMEQLKYMINDNY